MRVAPGASQGAHSQEDGRKQSWNSPRCSGWDAGVPSSILTPALNARSRNPAFYLETPALQNAWRCAIPAMLGVGVLSGSVVLRLLLAL